MVVKLNGADFSAQNIGTYELPEEINAFTLAAINASGNTFSNSQKLALNTFFKTLGAFGGESDIWGKLDKVYMPMLARDLSKAVVNYKTNNVDAVPDASWLELANYGIAKITGSTTGQALKTDTNYNMNWSNKSAFVFNASPLTDANASDAPSHGLAASGTKYFVIGANGVSSGGTNIKANLNGTMIDAVITNNSDDKNKCTLRGKSCNGTTVLTLCGDGEVKTQNVSSSASALLVDTPCTLYPFGIAANGAIPTGKYNGASIVGSYLTSEEMKTLQSAFDMLWSVIVN